MLDEEFGNETQYVLSQSTTGCVCVCEIVVVNISLLDCTECYSDNTL